ncbi:MAG: hypothetical protein GEU74_09920 [Nitriliruptorales bacterium]|nr:hypothetical protein [Nitriliruptorales bacterium]
MSTGGSARPIDNRPAVAALATGLLSLPATLTVIGGMVLGIVAIIVGFVGVSHSRHLGGAGEGLAAGGIAAGMFGMALATAIPMFLS